MLPVTEPSIRLRYGIKEDNLSITLRLLKRFPELLDNRDPSNGWTNLHYASYYGSYLIASNLIKMIILYHNDDNEVKLTFKQNSYLHLCVMNTSDSNAQTLHLLLQNFQNLINLRNQDGKTAMHLSAELDTSACLQLLSDLGADANIRDNNGDTALHLAMKMGNIKCIKILLSNIEKLDLEVKNQQGFTPVDVANSFDTIKLFEYFRKASGDLAQQQQQQPQQQSVQMDSSALSTPSMQIFQFPSSSNSSTPIKILPPLPSVTTNRRYSSSTTTSPLLETMTNSSALSLSSSGSSQQQQQHNSNNINNVTTQYNSITPVSRSRSASIKSEYYIEPSPKKTPITPIKISNIIKNKRSNTIDTDHLKLMGDIEEESKDNSQMIKKLSSSSTTNATHSTNNILKVLIKGKSK